jgi:hypothetical protein
LGWPAVDTQAGHETILHTREAVPDALEAGLQMETRKIRGIEGGLEGAQRRNDPSREQLVRDPRSGSQRRFGESGGKGEGWVHDFGLCKVSV